MYKNFNLIAFVFIFLVVRIVIGLSCKDENNENIDWFIIYKPPKSSRETSEPNDDGTDYVYLTSSEPETWKLSPYSIAEKNSMLGNTWKVLKQNEKTATYLAYNDEPPEPYKGSAVGHLKGYFVFNEQSGYWLIHSIPKFGSKQGYEFPESGLQNGQYAFCATYDASQLDEMCNHLLYCNPYIYERKVSKNILSLLGKKAKTIFTDKPAFIRKPPFLRISKLKSLGGNIFKTFAKDNQLSQDIFGDIIAEKLQTSLVSQTWRRGRGSNLPPLCEKEFSVIDATAIKLTSVNDYGEKESFSFDTTADHSKWTISVDKIKGWICFADLNRMKSQEKRGGGAICFQSPTVWRQFQKIVTDHDICPVFSSKS